MSQASHNTQPVSLRLSEVLADIGVDERTVMKRRKTYMLIESMGISSYLLQDLNSSEFILGSQTEGTTTVGLKSDIDILLCIEDFHVIQDSSECKPHVTNYLMIQDDTVAPGYCLLQRLSENGLRPNTHVSDEHHFRDRSGRVLLRNTIVPAMTKVSLDARGPAKAVRHGPAHTLTIQFQGFNTDFVAAFSCKSWPLKARQWLDQQGVGKWPSDDIRRCCSNTGCFVVGVGCKGSKYEEFEWRISTSLAERYLMFSLNITQIRCYVLMKMLLKTYINPYYEETISSFMCKTVLFQSIVNTHCNFWRESNLISCLTMCLLVLYNYVLNESCPHFIISVNNLMAGHITHESKPHILEILQNIIKSEGAALLEVECDDLGARLLGKFTYLSQLSYRYIIPGALLCSTSYKLVIYVYECLISISNCSFKLAIQTLLKYIFKLNSISNQGQELYQKACTLLTPWFCTTLGSVLASCSIQKDNRISEYALGWISMGLNTDVSSGKLKQASIFYCIGDSQRTEIVLRDIEGNYDLNIVEPICKCHEFNKLSPRRGFNAESDNHNEEAIQHIADFCHVKVTVFHMNYGMKCSGLQKMTLLSDQNMTNGWIGQ
ncbi:uncharacterized protein LOC123555005 [Mercenaria mercenaria]|uniref:uncharacterized protein LOC123555005 n=1 Tax=Mercenaria mercenaria TaxID=6596 RepID=UPI00234EF6FF|nr:uncharacterized protein LOC123555005 [Mercenaria mercenaria]